MVLGAGNRVSSSPRLMSQRRSVTGPQYGRLTRLDQKVDHVVGNRLGAGQGPARPLGQRFQAPARLEVAADPLVRGGPADAVGAAERGQIDSSDSRVRLPVEEELLSLLHR